MVDPEPSSSDRRTDTRDPRRSRERALKILFQADVRGVDADRALTAAADDDDARAMLDAVDDLTEDGTPPARSAPADDGPPPAIDGFTRALVLGVAQHRDRIDELISRYARRWQISRMPVVDRTVLRLATYELLHEATPAAVVIDQAVGLAKDLSTDDSGRYVNGVLESIRKDVATRASNRPGA